MAAGWVKSFQCKSRAFEDVYHHPIPSCRNSIQNLKDVVANPKSPKPKPKPKPDPDSKPKRTHKPRPPRRSDSTKPRPDPTSSPPPNARVRRTLSAPIKAAQSSLDPFFPSLSELPSGHPSRNVVEIIFRSRWGPKGFSGRVEMVFKIQSMPRVLARFEEFRDDVRGRAGSGSARCSADGNEMMRFRCLGPTTSPAGDGVVVDCSGNGKWSIYTYSGSGAAHESAGGGRGRRAMMVCRVIAGRVKKGGLDSLVDGSVELEYDSVSGDNGELLVLDSRAVLPCFLVIYKL